MKKIKFLKNCEVQDGSGTTFADGQVETMSDSSADHWLNRGKAVLFVEKPAADKEEAAPEAKEEPAEEEKPAPKGNAKKNK